MEHATISVPEDVRDTLHALAERSGQSEADVIRQALQAYIRDQRRQRFCSIGSISDPELRGRDIEDWIHDRYSADEKR
jgi:hypothetical protein